MLEIPCTMRCDVCKETRAIVAEAVSEFIPGAEGFVQFVINDRALPDGWLVLYGKLRCLRPSCQK